MIRRVLTIARTHTLQYLRSPALWALWSLALAYQAGEVFRSYSYLQVAYSAGNWQQLILPVGLGLLVVSATQQGRTHRSKELLASAPMWEGFRLVGEALGALVMALFSSMMTGGAVVIQYLLSGPAGIPSDLWAAILLAWPVLVFWVLMAQLIGRLVAQPLWAYLAVLALWVPSLLAGKRTLWATSISLSPPSELLVWGEVGRTILVHRAGLLGLGLLAFVGTAALADLRGGPTLRQRLPLIGAQLGVVLLVGALCLPGYWLVLLPGQKAADRVGESWEVVATDHVRWRSSQAGALAMKLAPAHPAGAVAEAVGRLQEGGLLPGSVSQVVVSPSGPLQWRGSALLIPETLLKNEPNAESLVRKLLVGMAAAQVPADPAAGPHDPASGLRLALEWVYARESLGLGYAESEFEQVRDTFTDTKLPTWLKVRRGLRSINSAEVEVALGLWETLRDMPKAEAEEAIQRLGREPVPALAPSEMADWYKKRVAP